MELGASRQIPRIKTERLLMRPFALSDAPRVMALAGDRRIAETTLNVPHPYEPGMAEQWIATHADNFYRNQGVQLALTLASDETLIGAIGLRAVPRHRRAEMGYWVGVPYWRQGYATEAAQAVIAYGFDVLGYHKIVATHITSNPASGRVMEKAGMSLEGELADHVLKNGHFHTLRTYGIINQHDTTQ